MVIKWTNKCSGEQGFVKNINHKAGYFENTFDQSKARNYSSSRIGKVIKDLEQMCDLNTYEGVDALVADESSPP